MGPLPEPAHNHCSTGPVSYHFKYSPKGLHPVRVVSGQGVQLAPT